MNTNRKSAWGGTATTKGLKVSATASFTGAGDHVSEGGQALQTRQRLLLTDIYKLKMMCSPQCRFWMDVGSLRWLFPQFANFLPAGWHELTLLGTIMSSVWLHIHMLVCRHVIHIGVERLWSYLYILVMRVPIFCFCLRFFKLFIFYHSIFSLILFVFVTYLTYLLSLTL